MMIHIVRIEKPKELTDEVVKQKTELYKKDNTLKSATYRV